MTAPVGHTSLSLTLRSGAVAGSMFFEHLPDANATTLKRPSAKPLFLVPVYPQSLRDSPGGAYLPFAYAQVGCRLNVRNENSDYSEDVDYIGVREFEVRKFLLVFRNECESFTVVNYSSEEHTL